MRLRFVRAVLVLCLIVPAALRFGGARAAANRATSPDRALMTISKLASVLTTTTTVAIFWGSQWTNAAFAGDKITGVDSFLAGFGGSHYAQIATEYYGRNGSIKPYSSYAGHAIDTSEPPGGVLTGDELIGEACRIARNNPDPNGVYFIYLSNPTSAYGGCPGHTFGWCPRNKPIQVAFAYYTSGQPDDPCGGEIRDTGEVTGHSLSLGQLGKVTANQLMNTITSPQLNGWADGSAVGIGGKCKQILPPPGAYETFSNGSIWKLQTMWSNAAYRAGTGLPNLLEQPGCVY
jgi:hypothetical protein